MDKIRGGGYPLEKFKDARRLEQGSTSWILVSNNNNNNNNNNSNSNNNNNINNNNNNNNSNYRNQIIALFIHFALRMESR